MHVPTGPRRPSNQKDQYGFTRPKKIHSKAHLDILEGRLRVTGLQRQRPSTQKESPCGALILQAPERVASLIDPWDIQTGCRPSNLLTPVIGLIGPKGLRKHKDRFHTYTVTRTTPPKGLIYCPNQGGSSSRGAAKCTGCLRTWFWSRFNWRSLVIVLLGVICIVSRVTGSLFIHWMGKVAA